MAIINIGTDFHNNPVGLYRTDGEGSAEEFRQDYLLPALEKLKPGELLTIVLDTGVVGYSSNFLQHSFALIVSEGRMNAEYLHS